VNWLAHLLLSHPDPAEMTGQLLGDFARGIELPALPAGVARGLVLHRAIDRFTDEHPLVRASRARLPPALRFARGVAVDVLYDHFLARDFPEHAGLPLAEFTRAAYAALRAHAQVLPPALMRLLPHIEREDWLGSYATRDGITLVLQRMERRLRRPLPLALAAPAADDPALAADFAAFFPALRAFAAR
jgi:acyl carrier protein phosphodiesterase